MAIKRKVQENLDGLTYLIQKEESVEKELKDYFKLNEYVINDKNLEYVLNTKLEKKQKELKNLFQGN